MNSKGRKSYATVHDDRVMCLTHGGPQPCGAFVVRVGSRTKWQERDTFQPTSAAETRCECLAALLQRAYDAGVRAGARKAKKAERSKQ